MMKRSQMDRQPSAGQQGKAGRRKQPVGDAKGEYGATRLEEEGRDGAWSVYCTVLDRTGLYQVRGGNNNETMQRERGMDGWMDGWMDGRVDGWWVWV